MGDALDGGINDDVGIKDAIPHKVEVSAFYMQKKEVSKEQWKDVRDWGLKHGYSDLPEGLGEAMNHPVLVVTWFNAVKWCNAKSEMDGLIPCYYTDVAQTAIYRSGINDIDNTMVKWSVNGYRLPTEAEWEKAARGGLIGKRFPWGDTISHEQANFNNAGKEAYQTGTCGLYPKNINKDEPFAPNTSPVGSFAANGYGLFDMAGNASEWCWDRAANYRSSKQYNPHGGILPAGRVRRGGSCRSDASHCRVAGRYYYNANFNGDFGFRLARAIVP